MPKSVLPRARASQLPGRQRGQSTGAGECDFRDFQTKCRNLYSPRRAPPSLHPREARARARGVRLSDFLPRARAAPCTPEMPRARARGSTIFETPKAQNLPPSSLYPKRGQSTGAEEYSRLSRLKMPCTPPRPCPPAPWTPERPEHGRGGVRFSRLSKLKMPKSVLPRARASQLPGQSTGAGEYDFRDFQRSKCRNLYSPAPVPPSSLDAREARARARGSTIFETFKAQNADVPPSSLDAREAHEVTK